MGKHQSAKSFRDLSELHEIGRMLQRMMDRAEDVKGTEYSRVGEDSPAYASIDKFFV